jgi:hypothetical protein
MSDAHKVNEIGRWYAHQSLRIMNEYMTTVEWYDVEEL